PLLLKASLSLRRDRRTLLTPGRSMMKFSNAHIPLPEDIRAETIQSGRMFPLPDLGIYRKLSNCRWDSCIVWLTDRSKSSLYRNMKSLYPNEDRVAGE